MTPHQTITKLQKLPAHQLAGILADVLAECACQKRVSQPTTPFEHAVDGQARMADLITMIIQAHVKELEPTETRVFSVTHNEDDCGDR